MYFWPRKRLCISGLSWSWASYIMSKYSVPINYDKRMCLVRKQVCEWGQYTGWHNWDWVYLYIISSYMGLGEAIYTERIKGYHPSVNRLREVFVWIGFCLTLLCQLERIWREACGGCTLTLSAWKNKHSHSSVCCFSARRSCHNKTHFPKGSTLRPVGLLFCQGKEGFTRGLVFKHQYPVDKQKRKKRWSILSSSPSAKASCKQPGLPFVSKAGIVKP